MCGSIVGPPRIEINDMVNVISRVLLLASYGLFANATFGYQDFFLVIWLCTHTLKLKGRFYKKTIVALLTLLLAVEVKIP